VIVHIDEMIKPKNRTCQFNQLMIIGFLTRQASPTIKVILSAQKTLFSILVTYFSI
jgi:hypothetical protein